MKRKFKAVLPQVLLAAIGPRLFFQAIFVIQFLRTTAKNIIVAFIQHRKHLHIKQHSSIDSAKGL